MKLSAREVKLEGFVAVRGPAVVSVVQGVVEVMGFLLKEGTGFVIPRARVAILRGEGATIEITGVSNGSVVELPQAEYEEIYKLAEEASCKRTMIVGPVDVGKSTLASIIAGRALNSGLRAELMTIDVGQNEIYCPGFSALASVNPPAIPGNSDSFTVVSSCFVGSFSPSFMLERYMKCAQELSRLASNTLVVDTDGWVENKGLEVKAKVALDIGIKLVIALGLDNEKVKTFLDAGLDTIVFKPLARSIKTSEERRLHRERLIAQKLAGARQLSVPLDLVRFLGDKPKLRPGFGVIASAYARGQAHPGVIVRVDEKKSRAIVLTKATDILELVEVGVSEIDLSWLQEISNIS
ncbi:MAG: Clp1/GlmU family protein [Acidilobaceae archaeon]